MKRHAKPGIAAVLTAGFGILVAFILFLGLSSVREADRSYRDRGRIHAAHREISGSLAQIESDIHRSGITVRDYLMDPDPSRGAAYRDELIELRSSIEELLARLSRPEGAQGSEAIEQLRRELARYWDSLEPLFSWTPEQRTAFSRAFLRREVLPRRMAILAITREIDRLGAASLAEGEAKSQESRLRYREFLNRMLAIVLALSLLVAGLSIYTISRLTRQSERARDRAESAEHELRRLSQKLVLAQEEERKMISRELHDEIGQTLTALRIELGNLENLPPNAPEEQARLIGESKALVAEVLNSVRNLAQGLRPSMLDDLGLGPALEWQVRDFSRRTGVSASVQLDGNLDRLPENIRTCIYRAAQESLTNCARHARARNVRVTVYGGRDLLSMTVQDDGVGFDPDTPSAHGLGLVGIEERVKELGGQLTIQAQPGQGSLVRVELPRPREAEV